MSTIATQFSPIAHTLPNAALASGMSRSKLYEYIKAGELPVVKVGRRTLITDDDLRTLIASLRRPSTTGGDHVAA